MFGGSPVRRHAVAGLVSVVASLACAVPASAQIYTWRDANGNLVLSDQRPSSETAARTFEVPKAPDVRATRTKT